jgi:hypothetical protein
MKAMMKQGAATLRTHAEYCHSGRWAVKHLSTYSRWDPLSTSRSYLSMTAAQAQRLSPSYSGLQVHQQLQQTALLVGLPLQQWQVPQVQMVTLRELSISQQHTVSNSQQVSYTPTTMAHSQALSCRLSLQSAALPSASGAVSQQGQHRQRLRGHVSPLHLTLE